MLSRGRNATHRLTNQAVVQRAFDGQTQDRGNRYFRQGRVVGVDAPSPTCVHGEVRGSERYDACVGLTDDGVLRLWCSCPVGDRYGEACKHLWALLREIDSRDLLAASHGVAPERVVLADSGGDVLFPGGDDDADELDDEEDVIEGMLFELDDYRREPSPARGPGALDRRADVFARRGGGARSLGGVGRDPRAQPAGAGGVLDALFAPRRAAEVDAPALKPLELFALLDAEADPDGPLGLVVLEQVPGGYRSVPLLDMLAGAVPGTVSADLVLVAYASRQAGFRGELGAPDDTCDVLLPPEQTRALVERVARAGRLLIMTAAETVAPIEKGSDVANLRMRVVVDPGESAYRLLPEVTVDGEALDPGEVSFVHHSGVAVFGRRLVTLASTAEAEWLAVLWLHGPQELVLAADELEAFLERYFDQEQTPPLDLPSGLELTVHEAAPQPFLDVGGADGSTQGLPLTVGVRYGDKEVPLLPGWAWAVDLATGRRIPRDPAIEAALRAELEAAGVRMAPVYDGGRLTREEFRIGSKRVPELCRTLLAGGWSVSVQKKPYRRAARWSLRASSGIDWLEIQGTVEMEGGQELPLGELLRALRRRHRSAGSIELDAGTVATMDEAWLQRFERLIDLGAEVDVDEGALRMPRAHAGAALGLLENADDREEDAGFAALREAIERGRLPHHADPPRGFRGTLRDYQRHGLGWLEWLETTGFGGCLADDMGLGKTVQVLAALLGRGRRHGPSLVVAPRSVIHNWVSEVKRFAPVLAPALHWGPERATSAGELAGRRLVVTTYATLARDIELLSQVEWDYLVLDEAQAIKNAKSQSAKLVRQIPSRHRLALTGTPIENHLGELWALLDFLNPGFGQKPPVRSGALSEADAALVTGLIKPFILRRTKRQVASDLPDRVEQSLEVDLSPTERRRYDELLKKLRREYSEAVAALGVQRSTPVLLTGLLRLRQAACHQGLLDPRLGKRPSSKLSLLIERLVELREEGAKALVFSQFTGHLDLVEREFDRAGIASVRLDGKTRRRDARVRAFQEDPSITVFLISLKAGGTGLNLTAAEYVFLLDPWWNPAVEAQAIDRAHRIGQTSRVISYRLIAKGTVEEKVAKLQQQKRDLVDSVFGDEEAFLGKLSREDLMGLLG